MPNISQVNYEESGLIAKNLHSDGDDLVQLYSQTRQRMQALRSEWAGDAAEAFFEEMEAELLPALQRVSGALFMGEEILNKIMNIIHQADEATAGYFNSDLNDDFGAGLFGGALGGVIGGVVGGTVGGGDAPGAGDPATPSQDSLPPAGTTPPVTIPVAPTGQPAAATTTPPPAATPPAADSGGGGGGGGGGSAAGGQGIQGDLKGLGTGVGNVQQVSSAGAGPQAMPDHVYEGSAGGSSGGGSAQPGPAGGGGAPQEPSTGGAAGVAGAAGVLGAAAAGAAKILKNDQNEPDK
jgi:WXG100 family type VII secretion target